MNNSADGMSHSMFGQRIALEVESAAVLAKCFDSIRARFQEDTTMAADNAVQLSPSLHFSDQKV